MITLKSFVTDLEEEKNKMQETLLNYEGRCEQLRIDIKRLEFAVTQGKAAIYRMEEDQKNDTGTASDS